MSRLRIASRRSTLALWQSHHIATLLCQAHPGLECEIVTLSTRGDRILDTPLPLLGGKGLFTAELEEALKGGGADLAVHSLKDLPTEPTEGLPIGAIPLRASAADVLISRGGQPLAALPHGAIIGTSSHRRAAQLRHHRPDLRVADVRGNIETRLAKALDPQGPYDAILLAHAALARLGKEAMITERLSLARMLPAAGQGALAVQCRADERLLALLRPLDDPPTAFATSAERAFLAALGGGCSRPIAAFALWEGAQLWLRGRVASLDGGRLIEVEHRGAATSAEEAVALGERLAALARQRGAGLLLEGAG